VVFRKSRIVQHQPVVTIEICFNGIKRLADQPEGSVDFNRCTSFSSTLVIDLPFCILEGLIQDISDDLVLLFWVLEIKESEGHGVLRVGSAI